MHEKLVTITTHLAQYSGHASWETWLHSSSPLCFWQRKSASYWQLCEASVSTYAGFNLFGPYFVQGTRFHSTFTHIHALAVIYPAEFLWDLVFVRQL
jgi:hypothetical protein